MGCSSGSHKESDMTEAHPAHTWDSGVVTSKQVHGGDPEAAVLVQCQALGMPICMDRDAWRAAIHGVAKSRT